MNDRVPQFRVYTLGEPPFTPYLMADGFANGCVALLGDKTYQQINVINYRRPERRNVDPWVNYATAPIDQVVTGYAIDHYASDSPWLLRLYSQSTQGRTMGYDRGRGGGFGFAGDSLLYRSRRDAWHAIKADHPTWALDSWEAIGSGLADWYEDGHGPQTWSGPAIGTNDGELIAFALRWLAGLTVPATTGLRETLERYRGRDAGYST